MVEGHKGCGKRVWEGARMEMREQGGERREIGKGELPSYPEET